MYVYLFIYSYNITEDSKKLPYYEFYTQSSKWNEKNSINKTEPGNLYRGFWYRAFGTRTSYN